MSSPHTASDVTSPAVRPSDDADLIQHGSSTAPEAEPEEIRPAVYPSHHATPPLHRSIVGSQGLQVTSQRASGDRDELSESSASTPRLPPQHHGNHELPDLAEEDDTSLETPDGLSPARKIDLSSNKHINPSASATISTRMAETSALPQDATSEAKPQNESESLEQTAQDTSHSSFTTSSHHTPIDSRQGLKESSSPEIHPLAQSPAALPPQTTSGSKSEGLDPASSAREEAFGAQRARSSSRSSQKRVEKSIEATLADEAPVQHARSRKSSHMLGIFKENVNIEGRKGTQAIRSPPTVSEDALQSQTKQASGYGDGGLATTGETKKGNRSRSHSALSTGSHSSLVESDHAESKGPLNADAKAASLKRDLTPPHGESLRNVLDKASKQEEGSSRRRLPPRLLEEIQQHHNLHTPFHDKFRQSQSKTTLLRPDLRKTLSESTTVTSKPPTLEKSATADDVAAHDEEGPEDDESDKEHISSALYYPHQTPSPDALQDVNIDEARKRKEEGEAGETSLPEPALSPTEEPASASQNVDIHLQSRKQSRYLHGDLPQARTASGEPDYTKYIETASSASESESESVASSSATDETEMTPRASPTTKASLIHSKAVKAQPSPLGAVELKPYNHQVGGHTTVFRFSKRAVCKQLTSRENRFYEIIEKYHPELLKFLPK